MNNPDRRKVMVITGASRGIGHAVALLAAEAGYDLCLNYLSNEKAAAVLKNETEALGATVLNVQADVGSEDDVIRLFKTVDDHLGRPDVLINNAGILFKSQKLESYDASRITRTLNTNVTGSFLCAREAILRMSTAKGGHGGSIVNLSSRAAQLGSPNEFIDYAASKGAIDAMTTGLAKEVAAEGIRVNAVRPGLIYTDIHESAGDPQRIERLITGVPMQRGGTATEVANAIMWLASDLAAYVTGAFIDVSGGR